ncbi:hypothetical protein M0R45_033621 [Rubus argutus]|uniref:Uncharacterized protein n=1 Tax=Rubus argutus TaxID=59490 RepID=A0AAW1WMD8_RUBAR
MPSHRNLTLSHQTRRFHREATPSAITQSSEPPRIKTVPPSLDSQFQPTAQPDPLRRRRTSPAIPCRRRYRQASTAALPGLGFSFLPAIAALRCPSLLLLFMPRRCSHPSPPSFLASLPHPLPSPLCFCHLCAVQPVVPPAKDIKE